jgi:hypothetical protein
VLPAEFSTEEQRFDLAYTGFLVHCYSRAEAGARIERGAYLALFGLVERSTGDGWWIESERDAAIHYFVITTYGTCTCQDHQRHGTLSPCKHALAVELTRRLERLEADREQRADLPITWELTPAAEAALAQLGEPVDIAPQCSRCHQEPACSRHPDRLGVRCIERELYGDNPDVA